MQQKQAEIYRYLLLSLGRITREEGRFVEQKDINTAKKTSWF